MKVAGLYCWIGKSQYFSDSIEYNKEYNDYYASFKSISLGIIFGIQGNRAINYMFSDDVEVDKLRIKRPFKRRFRQLSLFK